MRVDLRHPLRLGITGASDQKDRQRYEKRRASLTSQLCTRSAGLLLSVSESIEIAIADRFIVRE